jgi:hypothetical protein
MKESKAFVSEIKLAIKKLLKDPAKTIQLKHPFIGVYIQTKTPTEEKFEERTFSQYNENETGTFFLVYKNILG